MLAKIELRALSEKKSYSDIARIWKNQQDVEYYNIRVRGMYEHDKEIHFYTVDKSAPGWRIITPLKMDNGVRIYVDRGFVPLSHKDAVTRNRAQFSHSLELSGVIRQFADKRGLFVPDNNLEKNEWFWKSLTEMSKFSSGAGQVEIVPFFIESGDMANPGGWPRGGVTRLRLPNRHLEYALTWFGLAGTLFVMYLCYLWSRAKQ